MRHTILVSILLSLGALAGCAGDPALDGTDTADLALDVEVERDKWEAAEPGCEDVEPGGLTLASCEGEPLLGALVDEAGRVACVDALSTLLVENDAIRIRVIRPTSADPSPQPSHPGMEAMEGTEGAVIANTGAYVTLRPDASGDRRDPTPTPITEPLREDPTPTPIVRPEVRDDPTPTPIMQD